MEKVLDLMKANLKRAQLPAGQGKWSTRQELLQTHQGTLRYQQNLDPKKVNLPMTSGDPISQRNICTASVQNLKLVNIKDLTSGEPTPNTVIWLKNIATPVIMSSICLVVEDENKQCIMLALYNQSVENQQQVEKEFPVGFEFGVKNPYLKVGVASGIYTLRNDNPQNIIYKNNSCENGDPLESKAKGNEFFKQGKEAQALKHYQDGLKLTKDKDLKLILLTNSAQCYINLEMFEDALMYSNLALTLDKNHEKSLFRKAVSLAFLLKFDNSIEILQRINMPSVIQQVKSLQDQANGNYKSYFAQKSKDAWLLNLINEDIEIQLTETKGRGVFAIKNIEKGELILIEKPITVSHSRKEQPSIIYQEKTLFHTDHLQMLESCVTHARLKGLKALRLSYLYDGTEETAKSIPPNEIYFKNEYKKYTIKEMSTAILQTKVQKNQFGQGAYGDDHTSYLQGFESFFNHNIFINTERLKDIKLGVCAIIASRDIIKGEEIFIDYCQGKVGEERKKDLAQWGIIE